MDDADLEQLKAQARQWLDQEKRAERIREALENSRFKLRSITEVLSNPTRPKWLLRDTLEENVIALMAGPRGTYKSFIALHWSMLIALAGFEVLIISAEGAGIDRRIRAWLKRHAPNIDPATLKVTLLERRVNFNDAGEVADLVETIETLELKPKLVVIDTLSKNSGGLDENSNSEVKEFIGFIDTGIRRRFDCTVLLLHHTGHEAQGRARGASALEADTDAAYVIKREPGTKTVTVTRERFKDSGDLEPLAYLAEVIDLDEVDEFEQPITSLALVPTTVEAVSDRAGVPRGLRQRELLRALQVLQEKAGHELTWSSSDLRQIARDCGMPKQTAQDSAAALTGFYLVSTVGGYRLRRKGE